MTATTNSAAPESPTTYDETPYPAASFPQSHPRRLAAMARLFGVKAQEPSKARVLEIGCANGANLLPMAEQMPEAVFLGIDASRVQLEAGNKAIRETGLKNVELRFQNILDFPASEGKFDYIIAHGIYSWVPEPVREKMLAICRDHLAENGIAYISYNALPGWNMRRSLRDMMLFHTRGVTDSKAKVRQARALLKFLAESVPTENSAYGMLLKSELEIFGKAADNYFRHDILEEENTAFYFHEFCSRAQGHGLQYLSEPNLSQMLASNFPDNVSKTLAQVGGNIVAQEQYMDFLRNRFFRQTLLCRQPTKIDRSISSGRLRGLAFQSLMKVRTDPVDLTPAVSVSFEVQNENRLTTADPLVKAILGILTESGSRVWGYDELLSEARLRTHTRAGQTGTDATREDATLATNLFKLYLKGLLDIWADPTATSLTVPEKPALSPLMRYQALNSTYVTNWVHSALPADVFMRNIMSLCDGSRTKEQLADALVQRAIEGKLSVSESGKKISDPARIATLFKPRLDSGLNALARRGFFAA